MPYFDIFCEQSIINVEKLEMLMKEKILKKKRFHLLKKATFTKI